MKRVIYSPVLQGLCILLLLALASSCKDDSNPTNTGPAAKTINGTVNFVDTSFILSGGTYLISAYPSTGWPPTGGPAAYDTIHLTTSNLGEFNLSYNYQLKDLNPGMYVVSVGFRKSTGGQSPIMSVYGCDTARFLNGAGSSCFLSPPKHAEIGSNGEGTEGINMLSWSDTAKKVY